jgi:CBS domain containing-hemolysin-like protein
MIHGVLGLADRSVGSTMTPRREVAWVNLDDPQEVVLATIKNSRHAQLLVSQGSIDHVIGIVRKQDLLDLCLDSKALDVRAAAQSPVIIYEAASILNTLGLFKRAPIHAAIIVDEYGSLRGVVTQTDLLEAIAGDLPDPRVGSEPEFVRSKDDAFIFDAGISIHSVKELLELKGIPRGSYHTLAGFALSQMGRVPIAGESFDFGGWRFKISEMEGARIGKLLATRATDPAAVDQQPAD